MNNMLGESDLDAGGSRRPGARLTSMMAPSLVLAPAGPRLVVGSAGSVRLRGAIMQVVVNVLGHGLRRARGDRRPRVHVDEPHVHCEGGYDAAEARPRSRRAATTSSAGAGATSTSAARRAVEVLPDGALAAAGDPRRGGAGIVVG